MMQEITKDLLKSFQEKYDADESNKVIENAIARVGIDEASINHDALRRHDFEFNLEVKQGEPTAQKKSGRCWMFAALNSLRQNVMEKLNIESLELSHTYLYFFDKMEKSNVFLEKVIELKDEEDNSRLFDMIMDSTTYDGGYWEYFTGLIAKYGIVPESVMPETFHSEDSYMFTKQMDVRLRKTAMDMRKAAREGKSDDELREMKVDVLADIYNICVKVLGRPVEKFDFKYRDKDKELHIERNLTPIKFYEKYFADAVKDKIVLLCDPREEYPRGRVLRVKHVKNMQEKENVGGLNVPMEEMTSALLKSLKGGDPCWYACDVGKDINRKLGILDNDLYCYDSIFPELGEFSKADRSICQYSNPTHAMNITGAYLDENDKPVLWKVENSWGDDLGKKGTFSMTQEWFEDKTYELIVDKKYVSDEYLKGLDEEPIYIEPWNYVASRC